MKYSKLKKKKGYRVFKEEDKDIMVHRRVAEKKYGKIPKDFIIHHIDENKDNNRKKNLILLHRKDHYRIHVKKDLEIKTKNK